MFLSKEGIIINYFFCRRHWFLQCQTYLSV